MLTTTLLFMLMGLGFLVAIGLAVALLVRRGRQDREAKRTLAETLGFQPLDPVPAELSGQIFVLHLRVAGQRFSLRNVFARNLPEGQFYLFDLWEEGSESTSRVEQCAMAVVSPGANLPRFTVSPRLELPGTIGGLAGRLTDWMAKQFGPEIVTDQVEFEAHYLLTGQDEAAVRAAVSSDLLAYLGQSPSLGVQAGGNLFSVAAMDLKHALAKPDYAAVSALYNHAIRIAAYLFA
jgi:hypothetical protein